MLRWFEESGNNSDVVISSRVRLARNINGYNFSYKMSDTDAKMLVKNVTEQLKTVSPINSYNSYNFILKNRIMQQDLSHLMKMCQ